MRIKTWNSHGPLTTLALVGARWVYPPGTSPELVVCLDACAAVCGLSESRKGSVADLVCWRRLLAWERVSVSLGKTRGGQT